MKKQMTVRKTVLAALFLAIGLILPFITMQIPAVGKMLCPMHIPVLLCGYILGGPYGLIVGFITPLLRSVTFGMPVMLPNAICMAFELATYGLVSGILSGKMKKDMRSLYISLIISMLARIARRIHAGRAAQRIHLKPGIICNAGQTALPASGFRLEIGVFLKGLACLLHIGERNARLLRSENADAQGR